MLPRTSKSRAGAKAGIALLSAVLLAAPAALAQAPQPDSPAIRARVNALVHKMTLEQKLEYIGGTGFAVRAMPSLGLPALEMSDGPYGVRSNAGLPSTTYAIGIGLAASWNRDLAFEVGKAIGRDARARGVHFMLGPGIDIYRSPRNGRNFEYFGEDPFLTGAITVGYITGMQTEGVSSTVKHFLGNNNEYLRHDSDSVIDERTLREIYLPGFEDAVRKAHVGAIMDSYNLVNGKHMTQNGYFNTDIARKQWGFDGVMMSDWDATYDAVAAANGGLDIEMPTGRFMNPKNLTSAVESGKVSEATIDEKVFHILDTAARFGWLDRTQLDDSISLSDERNNAVALQTAEEGLVLLKNEGGLLPLSKTATKSILVVGPDAYPGVPVGGGSAGVKPFRTVSTLEGLTAYLGSGATVYYDRGLPTLTDLARDTSFVTEANGGEPGLKLETFPSLDLTGTPTTAVVEHINSSGQPGEAMPGGAHAVSHRWTGYYVAAQDGNYIIAMQGSSEGNGNRVYLDGKLIIDNWTMVRAYQPDLTLHLSAGPHKVVVEDAHRTRWGGRIRFGIIDENKIVDERAKKLAAKADVVVIAAGFDAESESEGSDRTFDLPFGQDQLIRTLAAINKKTIVTVTSGGNVDSESWLAKVPVYMENWYGGQDGGTALAKILFGDVNPSGHLPATFERRAEDNPTFNTYYPEEGTNKVEYREGIFVGYRGYQHNHVEPLYPFGFGLSYTTFRFSHLAVRPEGATATVSFDVTNTGKRTGKEVAQVYVSDTHSSVPRPEEELKGFEKVSLAPGQTKHVTVKLDDRAFAYYDTDAKGWHIAPGSFGIRVGDSSADIALKGTVEISKEAAGAAKF
ncbi:beta-glucosidase H [Edaphobacter sp.]|uniref:beta-glucosidase H n=1 Tax=Edaphobacter sp. TaxID=1934404 RepID=UPI002DBD19C7|nr:glycoside hydrolase family 3 C-terminal domain-containing protein [Edaphobacter sp.]HEU5340092.1 glycoside hydrolase family 3 C-terminal domain-containing protein [Edaphobacter sp.]